MVKENRARTPAIIVLIFGTVILAFGLAYYSCRGIFNPRPSALTQVRTFFGEKRQIGEPFGIAVKDGEVFVSDGENGRILRISDTDTFAVLAGGLKTPSGIAFDKAGDLIVADSGSHTIKKVRHKSGEVEILAGVDGKKGFTDGPAGSSLFNAPVGVAVGTGGKIYVADTYNDRIRVVEDGQVSTLAGSTQGFADGAGVKAKFDTPCGIAAGPDGSLIVADTGNARIRAVAANGTVRTLAGNGANTYADGLPAEASFARPTAVAIDDLGVIYIADGDSVRALGRRVYPFVETISDSYAGLSNGNSRRSRFNRPSGLALDDSGNLLVADSDNQLVRAVSDSGIGRAVDASETAGLSPEEFRMLGDPRWPYDPPQNPREIAGTLGELRGEIGARNASVWFHNGLDITGGYGERARFIRTETVLDPVAVQNFATLRELIRMPTIGYIHINLGRNVNSAVFADARFQFSLDEKGELVSLRVPRGTRFEAGESIGSLNSMNHVHLIAGRRGNEMNALAALRLPGVSDSRVPTIEAVTLFDEDWTKLETGETDQRITLTRKTRVVVSAFDQMDGNAERRRLGVYRLGYQLLTKDGPVKEVDWTIRFDRMPADEAVRLVFAEGSRSGATGQTVFNYIVSNEVSGERFREGFLDPSALKAGAYALRVFAEDYFGNQASKDIDVSVP